MKSTVWSKRGQSEEQLSASRRAFNAAVMEFNNAVEMFPSSIMAGWMHYGRRQFFETREEQRQTPDVGRTGSGGGAQV